MSGGWRFIDLGDGRSRVEFDLTYRFANRLFAKTFEKLFEKFSVILLIPLLSGRGKNMESPDAGNSRASGGRRIRYPMAMRYRFTEWRDFWAMRSPSAGGGNAASVGVWGKPSGHSRPLNSRRQSGSLPAAGQRPARSKTAKEQADVKIIADCRRARHDYFILETFVAGLSLQGWEVKSARAGKAQISESHVASSRGELFLLNSHFAPLSSASSHVEADPKRSRKLLMTRKEISNLAGKVQRAGFTLVPLNMHLLRGKMKLQIGLAKGQEKTRQTPRHSRTRIKREQQRIMRGEK